MPSFSHETNVCIQLSKEEAAFLRIFAMLLPLSLLHQRSLQFLSSLQWQHARWSLPNCRLADQVGRDVARGSQIGKCL